MSSQIYSHRIVQKCSNTPQKYCKVNAMGIQFSSFPAAQKREASDHMNAAWKVFTLGIVECLPSTV